MYCLIVGFPLTAFHSTRARYLSSPVTVMSPVGSSTRITLMPLLTLTLVTTAGIAILNEAVCSFTGAAFVAAVRLNKATASVKICFMFDKVAASGHF